MQTLFFLSALVATNLAVGWTWFCLRADRQRSLRNSYPDLLLLGVGVFLCWEPLLFARGLYFGLFYPEWGFIPAWICGYIAVALIFRVYKLRYWTRQAAKFFASKDLREKIFSCRRQLFVFFIGNLVFLSLCSFFFHDYARLAEVAVVAGQSVGESTDMLSPRGRTLNPVGEFTTRVTFPIAGGIIAIIALVFTWKRTSAMMRQTDNSYRQIHAEQFKNAVEHLGNEKQAIVLGGVHAMHDLARNNQAYRKQVFEVLCIP